MRVRLTREEEFKLNPSEKLLLFYRKYPTEAVKDLFNIDLTWFQRIALRGAWNKKYSMFLMGRGIGKTWLLALFACLYAILYPGAMIGIISPSFKQTEFFFDKIADFLEQSAYLRASYSKMQRTTFKALIKFNNGSFIEGLPLGTGEKIRGRRYNLVVIDEYAFVDEQIIKKVVRPMMNVKKIGIENKYLIASTAYYSWNHLYIQYLLYNLMSHKKPELYGLYEFTYKDLQLVKNAPYEMDEEVIEMMKMDSTEEEFSMENLCKFPVENVGFFNARLIDSCTPRATEHEDVCPMELFGAKNSIYTMGIDSARVAGGDNFSISILKIDNGIKKLVHGFTLNGMPYQYMIYNIRRLMQDFNIVQMNMDSGGGGNTLKDLLMQKYKTASGKELSPILDMDDPDMQHKEGNHILRMVNFTRPVVNDLFMRLKADMQHRTFNFPIDIRRHSDKDLEKLGKEILDTKRELLVLQAEGKGNFFVFDSPTGFKKDRAVSLALANQAANDFISGMKEEVKPQLAEGIWC